MSDLILKDFVEGKIDIISNKVEEYRRSTWTDDFLQSRKDCLKSKERLVDEDFFKETLGRSWKATLSNMVPFVIKTYNIVGDFNKVCYLATTSKNLSYFSRLDFIKDVERLDVVSKDVAETLAEKLFGKNEKFNISQKCVSKYIKNLEKMGVALEVDGVYTFESEETIEKYPWCDTFETYAKTYYISEKMTTDIILFIFANCSTIREIIINNNNNNNNEYNNNKDNIIINNDKDNRKNNLRKRLLPLLEKENERLPMIERFNLDLKGRAYSEICSKVSLEKQINLGKTWVKYENTREDYLDKVFGKDGWKEFDRRGSIYNLAYLLCKGTYLANTEDFYRLINGGSLDENNKVVGGNFDEAIDRGILKDMIMLMFFKDLRSINSWFMGACDIMKSKNKLKDKDSDFLKKVVRIVDYKSESVKEVQKVLLDWAKEKRENLWNLIGKDNIKEIKDVIFLLESEAYVRFAGRLRDMGLRVVQVYDAVYISKDVNDDLLEETLKDVLTKYRDNIKENK